MSPLGRTYHAELAVSGLCKWLRPRGWFHRIAATFTQTNQRMGPRHEGFVATAKQGNIDLLLHGDSITDWWQQEANKPVFDKYFGRIRTADFAIAGDTTQGVLWGLRNGEGQGFQPKAVMLMIGTNNTGTFTAPEIAEGVGAVVMELRQDFPDAKILLLAIFPRSVPGDPCHLRHVATSCSVRSMPSSPRRARLPPRSPGRWDAPFATHPARFAASKSARATC